MAAANEAIHIRQTLRTRSEVINDEDTNSRYFVTRSLFFDMYVLRVIHQLLMIKLNKNAIKSCYLNCIKSTFGYRVDAVFIFV